MLFIQSSVTLETVFGLKDSHISDLPIFHKSKFHIWVPIIVKEIGRNVIFIGTEMLTAIRHKSRVEICEQTVGHRSKSRGRRYLGFHLPAFNHSPNSIISSQTTCPHHHHYHHHYPHLTITINIFTTTIKVMSEYIHMSEGINGNWNDRNSGRC